jgi:hypothetical protein
MMRSAILARPLTRSDRAKISKWRRRVKERLRAGRRDRRDDHLVRGDDDLAEAIVDYSSIATCGWTWPGEELLAEVINESDRNVRKRIARLRAAGLLIVIPSSDGWAGNRYVPVLDGQPLFEVALTSEQVRNAVATLRRRGGGDTGTPVPPQSTAETGTPVPPEEVRGFQQGRNAHSAESSRKNLQERNSPTPTAMPTASLGEEDTLDPELQQARSAARPKLGPTPGNTTESTEQPTRPDGCPRDDKPEVRSEPDTTELAAAPVVEFSFELLMRDYRHPPGDHGVERQAYRPHARIAWGRLTAAQKQDAARAASKAPGKEWLGHWLDSGRETGKFEIVEQDTVIPRVWVRNDTPQWAAWVEHDRANSRCRPQTQHCVQDEMQTGWWFESGWPPGVDNAKRSGGAP